MKLPLLRVELFLAISGDKLTSGVLFILTKLHHLLFYVVLAQVVRDGWYCKTLEQLLASFIKNRSTTREMKQCPAAKDIHPLRTVAADRRSSSF